MVEIPPDDFPDIKVFHFKYVSAVHTLDSVTREFIFTLQFLFMPIFYLRNPEDIPWGRLEVDYVIESTDSDAAAAHLKVLTSFCFKFH